METLDVRLQKRMHVSLYALIFLTVLLGISILLEGCTDSCETRARYMYYEPTYTPLEELRSSIQLAEARPIKTVGKIYRRGDVLFINEPGKGIHIVDNADPSKPNLKSFLEVPGNFDLAVKENTLYADSYIDLVAFDISNISDIRPVARLENVFHDYNYPSEFRVDPSRGLITGWTHRESMEVTQSDCKSGSVEPFVWLTEGIAVCDVATFNSSITKSLAIAPGNGSGPGAGGSMARFAVEENYLYALDAGSIQAFDITSAHAPVEKEESYISWDIETIFPYNHHLFIGSSSGMHILNLSDPAAPQRLSTYSHITSCDPVAVDEKYAYVTLRSGTTCQGFTNQLEVIDITDLTNPQLQATYPMFNPHGLGIDNKTLFVCDGDQGLKIYDASNIQTIPENMLAHYNSIHAYDVIPLSDVLVMIGNDGLFQYDYSNPKEIRLLSHLPVHAN